MDVNKQTFSLIIKNIYIQQIRLSTIDDLNSIIDNQFFSHGFQWISLSLRSTDVRVLFVLIGYVLYIECSRECTKI